MKICIIGPTGSGKTDLAKELSERYRIKHTNLDYVFFKHVVDKSRIELPEKKWKENLNKLVSDKNWIIEGVNPLIEVFEKADKIIYLRYSLLQALYSQWKRYFTDARQRKEHGFANNVKLTRYLLRQYLQEPDPKKYKNPKYSRVRKIDRMMEKYTSKLIKFTSRKEANMFIKILLVYN